MGMCFGCFMGCICSRLMKLIINSLYKSKEIFLRELISNASDALDKLRFIALTDASVLASQPKLRILVRADPSADTLTIIDNGIGMTRDDLKHHLGTIAKSGTADFLTKLEAASGTAGGANTTQNLIGQFGVGFYSAFLVADRVTVASMHYSEPTQHIWQSDAVDQFTVGADPRGNTLGRGTQITLHLKGDSREFLKHETLRELIRKYSEFITFPIYLWSEEGAKKDGEKSGSGEEDDTETHGEWQLINEKKPIWMRAPSEVSEEEYHDFYKAMSKDYADPVGHIHFRAEASGTGFRAMVFFPKRVPVELFQSIEALRNVRLFVRRVFITDTLANFLPRYLSFLRVLVDADDLPLNVSRETLQHHKLLNAIRRKIVRKIFDYLESMAAENPEQYQNRFVAAYSAVLKAGVLEEHGTRYQPRLLRLLRYATSHTIAEGDGTHKASFAEYIVRMRENQPGIYVITGSDVADMRDSPYVEKVVARGYEVVYMDEPVDEYLLQEVREIDGVQLINVAKSGLKFGDEDDHEATEMAELKNTYEPLIDRIKQHLSRHIDQGILQPCCLAISWAALGWLVIVIVSNRLTTSPCAIVANMFGWSGNFQRIVKAQAAGQNDPATQFFAQQKKIMEINPHHPLMRELLKRVEKDEWPASDETRNDGLAHDNTLADIVDVLYQTALLRSGFDLDSSAEHASRIERLLRRFLDVDIDASPGVKVAPAAPIASHISTGETQDQQQAVDKDEEMDGPYEYEGVEREQEDHYVHDEL